MNISVEALLIFLFLIPGFLSTAILDSIIVRSSIGNLSKIVEALVFTFVIYVILSIFTSENPIFLSVDNINEKTQFVIHYNSKIIVFVFLLSIIFPITIGYSITHDIHMKFLRWIRVTNKTARNSVWLDVFSDQGKRKIIVHLTDGRRIFGWPLYYSNTPEEGKIYLYKPAWLYPNGKIVKLPIHGFFLVKKNIINSIEFLQTAKEKGS